MWILTFDGDEVGDQLGAVLVGGFTLVEARLLQQGGGDAEGERGRGVGVAPQKLLPISPQHHGGGRSSVRTAGQRHPLALQHLLTWTDGQDGRPRSIWDRKQSS